MDEKYKEILKQLKTLPDRVSKKEPVSKATYWKYNWNKDYYLQYVIDFGRPYQKIIGKFLQLKKTKIENYSQVNFFFQRNERIAKQIEGFSLEQIAKVYAYLEKKMSSYRIALETIGKFLEEDIDALMRSEEKPILILKNKEYIYDTKRIKQLEQQGRIFWKNGKWQENLGN